MVGSLGSLGREKAGTAVSGVVGTLVGEGFVQLASDTGRKIIALLKGATETSASNRFTASLVETTMTVGVAASVEANLLPLWVEAMSSCRSSEAGEGKCETEDGGGEHC